MGFKIGAIKHTHHVADFDKSGKDSWKLAEAGADTIGLVTAKATYLLYKTEEEQSVEDLRHFFSDVDIILAEGFKGDSHSKIEVVRTTNSHDLICSPDELTAIVADVSFDLHIPQFHIEDVSGVAGFLIDLFKLKKRSY